MGTSINPSPTPEDQDPATDDPTNEDNLNDDDEMDVPVESPNHEDILDSTGRILEQQPAFDKIINAEVMIQNGDEMAMGKVARRSLDADGGQQGLTMTTPSSIPSHTTLSSPMDKSGNTAPTLLPKICSPKLTRMDTSYP